MRNLLILWTKRAIPALALAGLALTACEKEPVEKTPVYRAPYEQELSFDASNFDSVTMQIVQKFARDTACKHIYLTNRDRVGFLYYTSEGITELHDLLNKNVQLAPNKISGRGNFIFKRGVARPADSIWFVQNGWTVNQH